MSEVVENGSEGDCENVMPRHPDHHCQYLRRRLPEKLGLQIDIEGALKLFDRYFISL